MAKNKSKKIHFVGIGGVSMYSLAMYAINKGYYVTGSNISENNNVKTLKKMGIKVYNNHSMENIKGANVVVYSNAAEDVEEVLFAKSIGIKTMPRAKYLAQILKQYKTNICVSGAHGKTTTSAMIYSILNRVNNFCGLHLGANLAQCQKCFDYSALSQNFDKKQNNYIVCEACEYKDSFLCLKPNLGVILNIAPEHLDYFKTLDNVKKSFNKFASKSDIIILNQEYQNCIKQKNKKIITFGLKNADFTAKNIKIINSQKLAFDCYKQGKYYTKIKLNSSLEHNVLNALASIAVCDTLLISKTHICAGLNNFEGVERRFQKMSNKFFFVHDYAHHPDEIKTTINEAKKLTNQKLLVVFQPHTYSRTKTLFNDFLNCFEKADELLFYKTYSAREKYNYKGSANFLAKKLKQQHAQKSFNIYKDISYIKNKKDLIQFIIKKLKQNYACLVLGAGDIYELVKNIQKCVDKA